MNGNSLESVSGGSSAGELDALDRLASARAGIDAILEGKWALDAVLIRELTLLVDSAARVLEAR